MIVTIPLNGGLPHISPELDPKELAMIGLVTTQWAILEHQLMKQSLDMANARGIQNENFFSLSFKNRFKAWCAEVKHLSDSIRKTDLQKLEGKIANCMDKRHKITHGLWSWEENNPEQLKAFSTRKKFEFEVSIDLEKLESLAEQIGEINFILAYENGIDDLLKEKSQEELPYFSRNFVRAVRSQD